MSKVPEGQIGQRFSQNYMRAEEALKDSRRARRRFAALSEETVHPNSIRKRIELELGIHLEWADALWRNFDSMSLKDFLDLPWIMFRLIAGDRPREFRKTEEAKQFIKATKRIFDEERLAYSVDDFGGVHPLVDVEFRSVEVSTLQGLGERHYGSARAEFERAYQALGAFPVEGKHALRSMFSAVEAVFRTQFPKAPRLGVAELRAHLKPSLESMYIGRNPEHAVALRIFGQLCQWTDAAHWYRHEPGKPEPVEPSWDVAVALMQHGSAHIRWLIAVAQELQLNKNPTR